jgi:hypothetical protein
VHLANGLKTMAEPTSGFTWISFAIDRVTAPDHREIIRPAGSCGA